MRVITYPEPQLRSPRYYRDNEARDMQLGPAQGISWQPRPLRQFVLPQACRLYWQAPETTTSAPAPTEMPLSWRRPITYQPLPIPIWFNGNIGEDVPAAPDTVEASEQRLKPLQLPPPPRTLYLFSTHSHVDQTAQPHTPTPWAKPITYRPYQPQAMLRQILYNLANPEPGPQSESQQHWIPKSFRNQAPPPILRYLFNPAQDVIEEPSSQFTVFWSYQTHYEEKVRQFFLRGLQAGSKDGVSVPESPAFPGFVNRPIRLSQVPAIAKLLYQNNPAQDFDATPAESTYPGWVGKPLWPFMAPKGAYMYYRSGLGKDEPAPLPTPTGGGHLTAVYRRRMELLGVRLGISAG